jgi:hypothetical protein
MKKLLKRYYKKTPKFFRKLGDTLLACSTMVAGYATYAGYEWTAYVAIISGVVGKFLTNFATDEK